MFPFKSNSLTKLLAAAAMITAFSAYAGTKDGGGGGAYVCRNGKGSIRKAMLADLWEAQNTTIRWPHKKGTLRVEKSNASAIEQFKKALAKLAEVDPGFASEVEAAFQKVWGDIVVVPPEVSIAVPNDLKNVFFPTGCPAEGMMYYDDDTELLNVRSDIFEAMDKESQTDKAAAYMHEALYKVLRDQAGHEDSRRARRLVGCLFSSEDCLPVQSFNAPSDRIAVLCYNDRFSLLAYPDQPVTDPAQLPQLKTTWTVVARRIDENMNRTNPRFQLDPYGTGMSMFATNGTFSAYGVNTYLYAHPMQEDAFKAKLPEKMRIEAYGRFSHSNSKVVKVGEDLPCHRLR